MSLTFAKLPLKKHGKVNLFNRSCFCPIKFLEMFSHSVFRPQKMAVFVYYIGLKDWCEFWIWSFPLWMLCILLSAIRKEYWQKFFVDRDSLAQQKLKGKETAASREYWIIIFLGSWNDQLADREIQSKEHFG